MSSELLCVLCREHAALELRGVCGWCADCRVLGDPRPVKTLRTEAL